MTVKCFTNNPFQEHTYVVYDDVSREAAIIDCGALFPNEQEAVGNFVSVNNINVKYLLNTHLHLDHCFGNYWAASTYGVLPLASADDQPLLAHMADQARMFGLPFTVTPQPLGGYLSAGEVIKFGDISFRVLSTPGHTPGGVCFYSEKNNCLFAGDTIFNGGVGRTDLEGGSMTALVSSIRREILPLPDNTVIYCGHGPQTTVGDEKQYNPYI